MTVVVLTLGRTCVGLGNGEENRALFCGKCGYIDVFTLFVLQDVRGKTISNVNRRKCCSRRLHCLQLVLKKDFDTLILLTAVASVAVVAVAAALAARRADRLGSDIVVCSAQGGYKLAAAISIIVIAKRHANIGPLGFNSQISRIKTALHRVKKLESGQIVKQYKG